LKQDWPAYYPYGNRELCRSLTGCCVYCVSNPIIDCHASYFMLEGDPSPSLVEPRERLQRNIHGDYRSAVACSGLVCPLALDGWLEGRHHPHRIHARTITQLFPLICLEERLVDVRSRWIYLNFFFGTAVKGSAINFVCVAWRAGTTWLCYPLWFAG
jgi:hypothetical protein